MEGTVEALRQYFPKQPYTIQIQIADQIYQALQKHHLKVMIIESPTGTGKTYSLLCPILAWLTHNKINLNQPAPTTSTMPSWLKKPSQHKGQQLLKAKEKGIAEMLSLKMAVQTMKNKKKISLQRNATTKKETKEEDGEIEIQSQEEVNENQNKKKIMNQEQILIENQLKLEDTNVLPKLLFVSRTHSQLSQVIDSLKQILKDRTDLTYLELASKQQLCINKSIKENQYNVNQQCQQLLDHSKCPYYHHLSIKDFLNKNLSEVIETGSINELCPYYSSRVLTPFVDILCLPYSSILNPQIRNKLGINIHNSILVFDEGHNVLEYEKKMKSSEVKVQELQTMSKQIDEYLAKFGGKLRVRNERLLTHLLQILRSFVVCTNGELSQKKNEKNKYVRLKYLDFLLKLGLKQLKIHKIIKYFQVNNVDKKLAYFNAQHPQIQKKPGLNTSTALMSVSPQISTSTINRILQFLLSFVSFNQQRQVLMLKWGQSAKGVLKIMCLQSEQLQKLIEKSRMTIIAGGTMQPLDELQQICSKWKDKTSIKKYPHIVKNNQCKIFVVKKHRSKDILFNHQSLTHPQAEVNFKHICREVMEKIIKRTEKGGGIVIFIQNYQLLTLFRQIFKGQAYENNILFDSREKKQAQDLFSRYKKLIDNDRENHHILVSVMGGKLSEGINFSDRLARALVVFGLPYSNIFGPEIIETMSYLDSKKNPKYTGKVYYENLCFKTLNQTIGRGIRHVNDYVDIYLVDSRFDGVKSKLSSWMQQRISVVKDVTDI